MRSVSSLCAAGRGSEAVTLLASHVSRVPGDVAATKVLGRLLLEMGDAAGACGHLARGARVKASDGELQFLLGDALLKLRRFGEARGAFEASIRHAPQEPLASGGLSRCLLELGDAAGSVDVCRETVRRNPKHPDAHRVLTTALVTLLRQREGVAAACAGLTQAGEDPLLLEAAVYAMNVADGVSGEESRAMHQRLARAACPPASRGPASFARVRDPSRPLRVGFLSCDFKHHSCAYFLESPLALLDRGVVTPVLYSTTVGQDEVTDRFRAMGEFRDLGRTEGGALGEAVERDQIDVMVDLCGWTARGHMRFLATRVAPVQIAYLGYPNTSALPAMDLRIVDAITDPVGSEAHSTERLIRLPRCFVCFRPDPAWPAVATPPLGREGIVTFGSFNHIKKVGERTIELWGEILSRVPRSRLLIKSLDMPGAVGDEVRGRLARAGVDPARVEVVPYQPDRQRHIALYERVDIALDSGPYNGTTTTCEALWMGVPVVTLAGDQHRARVGASLLTAIGLTELIAGDEAGYVEIASVLASEPARLAAYRATMRDRMMASELLDGASMARALEGAIRDAWRQYCGS
jgi:predicted O-linked N-acetylglucosamine transferase (SPINDLY family)